MLNLQWVTFEKKYKMSDFAFKLRRPFVFDCWTLYAFSTLVVYHYKGATYFVAVNWLNNDKSSFSSVCRWIETCWSFWKKEAKKYVHIGNTLSLLLTTLKKCIEPFTKSCIAHSFLKGVLFCLWQVTFPDHCLFHLLSIHLQKTLKKSSTAKLVCMLNLALIMCLKVTIKCLALNSGHYESMAC